MKNSCCAMLAQKCTVKKRRECERSSGFVRSDGSFILGNCSPSPDFGLSSPGGEANARSHVISLASTIRLRVRKQVNELDCDTIVWRLRHSQTPSEPLFTQPTPGCVSHAIAACTALPSGSSLAQSYFDSVRGTICECQVVFELWVGIHVLDGVEALQQADGDVARFCERELLADADTGTAVEGLRIGERHVSQDSSRLTSFSSVSCKGR